ncbi:MAG: M15 family metallopeptidase [Treponema sp.]|jgi:hypothetical protein|nr:M15 family metallopeptidase [Treponema sp.]
MLKRLIAMCLILMASVGYVAAAVGQQTRPERIVRSIHAAHPQRVSTVAFRNGDWAVLVDGRWFYYAEGRFLPRELRYRISRYRPVPFYNYARELAPWVPPTPEQVARFRQTSTNRAAQLPRSEHLFNAIYRASTREEAERQLQNITFFGHRVRVHNAIVAPLSLVEQRVRNLSVNDASVRAWINNIDRTYGFVWRNIGGTQSRSFHSYGIAIDIMPRYTGGREVFWGWARTEWWNIPHERRYHPPTSVVQAFEAFGFIWGGKWSIFDTIHFEYRPELLLYNSFVVEHRR